MSMSSAYWCTKPLWYVDPVAGHDEAEGDIDTPIKTITMLERRWNYGRILQVTDVNILGSLVANDQIKCRVDLDKTGLLRYKMAATSLGTGTFTAVTNYPVAPTTLASVTDSARAVSGWAFAVGKRIRNTTTGAISWVVADVGGGTGTALVTAWSNPTTAVVPIPSFFVETAVTAGDAYVVEDLGQARLDLSFGNSFSRVVHANDVRMTFEGFWFRDTDDTHNAINCGPNSFGPVLIGCNTQTMDVGGAYANSTMQSCRVHNLAVQNSSLRVHACFVDFNANVSARNGGRMVHDYNTIAYGSQNGLGRSELHGYIEVNRAASVNSQGHGVWCRASSKVSTSQLPSPNTNAANPIFWGSGNVGYGVRCEGEFIWDTVGSPTKPTVTGALGDVLLGGSVTPWSALTGTTSVNGANFIKAASS